jgi:hypothetical protein
MLAVLRSIFAIAVAITVTVILLIAVELFSAVVHPFPEGFQETFEEICRHVERYPAWVLAVAVPMWAATAFAGTWVAGRLGNRICAAIIGVLIVSALAWNLALLPYPIWFKLACLIAIPLASALAYRLSPARPSPAGRIAG